MSSSMMLHCGGIPATFEDVRSVPMPEATDTYRPIPYADLIDYLKTRARDMLGLRLLKEGYGLNKAGNQLFGLLVFEGSDPEMGISTGFRQSYNKSIAPAVAGGGGVFVCDNLMLSGDSFLVIRRNTKHVWDSLRKLVDTHLKELEQHYQAQQATRDRLKSISVNLSEGYRVLGEAQGVEVLTPQQASVAIRDWRTPRHE